MVPHYRCPPLCTRANTKRAVCGCTQGGGGGGCALFKRYFTRSSFAKSTNGGLRIPCINYKSEETSFPVLVLRACFLLPSLPGESGGIFGEYFDVETIISGSRRFYYYRDKIVRIRKIRGIYLLLSLSSVLQGLLNRCIESVNKFRQ